MSRSSTLRRPSTLIALAVLLAVAVVWGVTLARANGPQTLDDHVTAVASQLQCPVCNGESVAQSSSPVAQEMRSLIRQQLASGQSDDQVLRYFQAHYGDTILETPPKQGFTAIIWLGPVVALLVGLFILRRAGREWRASRTTSSEPVASERDSASETLTDEERRYRELLRRELDEQEGFGGKSRRADAWG
jgi:cytochrome c-type biogenesis protein CcmH